MAQRRPLTTKQLKFVKAKVSGKTGTQAAMEAYNTTEPIAASIATENLRKQNIQEALQAEFAKQGITLEAIVKPIADGLKANKLVVVSKDETATVDQPDHSIRLKASSMAAQFMGIGRTQGGDVNINFIGYADKQRDVYDL